MKNPTVTTSTARLVKKVSEDTVDLYRAVSPTEFDDLFATGRFRLHPQGLNAKQFGLDLDETIRLADYLPDTAAVVRARIPRGVLGSFDLTPVDRTILRSGSVTVHGGQQLDLLNQSLLLLEHAF